MARLTRFTLLTLAIAWLSVPRIESVSTKKDVRKKSEDICSLPRMVGRCRAAFPRWFFNSTTGTCEKFIYGGCDGNENNFESLHECQAACEKPHNKENGDSKLQYEKTAEEFHVFLEKGRNPSALREFFPQKQRQHILPSLLMRRSNLDEGKSSQLEKTEEVYKKLNKLNVHPEDLRVFFPVRHRVRRDKETSKDDQAEVDHDIRNITDNPQNGDMSQDGTDDPAEARVSSGSTTASTSRMSTTGSPSSSSSSTTSFSSSTQTQPKTTTIKVKPVAEIEEPQPTLSTAVAEKTASTAAEGETTSSTAAEGETTTSTAAEGKTTSSSTAAEGKTTTSSTTTAAPTSSTTVASTSPITTTTTVKKAGETTTTTVPITTTSTTATTSLMETTTTTAAPTTSVEASSSTVAVITNYEGNVPDTDGSHGTGPGGYPDASSSSKGEPGNVPDHAGPEGSQIDNQDFHYNVPRRNQLQEHTSSHFAAFFLSSIVLVFAIYVAYHNRQKIIAIIIEGRSDNRRKPGYRKLEANVEEAMPSMRSTNTTYVY